ncbi:MAG: HAD family hydrolase [Verrucomicrobia bacterium]|nr:HAD family hydrolase [Verrucomicrobiota bacterium]
MNAPTPAVFLDRDGTLIEERHYLSDPEQVVLFPGVAEALLQLQNAGFDLFLVTNQSGVGRGYYTMAEVDRVHERLIAQLGQAFFRHIYVAPEAPDQPSLGRKPSPHFLFEARDRFHLDLASSYMVGDKLIDLECGWTAGLRKCLLVRTGYGAGVERVGDPRLARATIVDDLPAATRWILRNGSRTTLNPAPPGGEHPD